MGSGGQAGRRVTGVSRQWEAAGRLEGLLESVDSGKRRVIRLGVDRIHAIVSTIHDWVFACDHCVLVTIQWTWSQSHQLFALCIHLFPMLSI